ncbi:MAG TPA: fatty acid desaturase [bacterium]|jgi:beta-carotene ketolase (CrtW type)|nr:fatty acid desaturase [bacterium]HOX85214.1 fatty acid desaturase [bacterium]HPG44373.1 fatty acid desaturase [bacterium]HPM96931.1 fatty acid desaturase [bacterium]
MIEKQKQICQPGKGVLIAAVIWLSWLGALIFALSQPFAILPAAATALLVVLLTFLYTGLFITAHDAMHGSVAPGCPGLNRLIGQIAVRSYAFMSYKWLLSRHGYHHQFPASEQDPDYHDGKHRGFWPWYGRFMRRYLKLEQLVGMAVLFNLLLHVARVPLPNILLFWVLPALLSTVQLFAFGTFLPHREPAGGYDNPHRSHSNDYPVWLSFLTCYHFGYHWEHHEYPTTPWWQLPNKRQKLPAAA